MATSAKTFSGDGKSKGSTNIDEAYFGIEPSRLMAWRERSSWDLDRVAVAS